VDELRDPGPPPARPVVPFDDLHALEHRLAELENALAVLRRGHEAAADAHAGPDRFVGEVATTFREELVDQLRWLARAQQGVADDRVRVRHAIEAGHVLLDHHERELAVWRRRRHAWDTDPYRPVEAVRP
jgi:hypothetical protein